MKVYGGISEPDDTLYTLYTLYTMYTMYTGVRPGGRPPRPTSPAPTCREVRRAATPPSMRFGGNALQVASSRIF